MINDLKNQEASGMEVSPNNSRCRNFAIRWQESYYAGVISMVISILNLIPIPVLRYVEDLSKVSDLSEERRQENIELFDWMMGIQYILGLFYALELIFRMYARGIRNFFTQDSMVMRLEIVF
jgi:hypothetical protein